MGIESIIILFGSIGFVLMGFFALYVSTKENRTTKEQKQYIKVNGLLNIAIGAIGTIIVQQDTLHRQNVQNLQGRILPL